MKKPYALITRPLEDAKATAANLEAMGIDSFIEPLLEIIYLPEAAKTLQNSLNGAQGIIVTSSNAVRALHSFSVPKDFPLIAVGEVTAIRANELGFNNIKNSVGDVHNLVDFIVDKYKKENGKFIYASATITAGNLAQKLTDYGFAVDDINVYRSVPAEQFSRKCFTDLKSFNLALLYSPRTAKVFATLLRNAQISNIDSFHVFCLSNKVANYMKEFGFKIHIAKQPDNESLLELIRNFKF